MSTRREFGIWIKQRRAEKGLTLQALSDLLGYKAIGPVNNIERGIGPIPVEKIHPYAKALGIPVEQLLEEIRKSEPELWEKYSALRRDIAHHLVFGPRAGLAMHHSPFPSDNVSYVNRTHFRNSELMDSRDYILCQQPDSDQDPDPCRIDPHQHLLFPLEQIIDSLRRDTGVHLQ